MREINYYHSFLKWFLKEDILSFFYLSSSAIKDMDTIAYPQVILYTSAVAMG